MRSLYTLLLLNIGYQGTIEFKSKLDIIIAEKVLEVVWVTNDIDERAWKIFKQFNTDKQWSFTDCTSYVIMKDIGIGEVFSFDHHFKQMGFVLKP